MTEATLTVTTRKDLDPLCPHCEKAITQVYYKATGVGWFFFPRSAVYFCSHCLKVLGMAQSKMA